MRLPNNPAAILMATTLATSGALAETQSAVQLKSIKVSATRIERAVEEVIRPIYVVDRQTMDAFQPQSVPETIAIEPNVAIAGGPRPSSQNVNIRGISGNRVLQLVDGVRQQFESGHRPTYFVDPELLKSIEVVKGPTSSLWGSGAIGGVVAQNTISPGELLSPESDVGGYIKAGYNDNNEQWTTSAAVAGRANTVDWLLSGYYRDSNDIELGNGDSLVGSAEENYGALAKVEWQLTDSQVFGADYRQSSSEGHVPSNGSSEVNSTSNQLIDRNTDTNTVALDYGVNTPSEWVDADAKVYWNRIEVEEERLSDNRADKTKLDVYGFGLNNVSRVNDFEWLYGADGYKEDFSASREGADRPEPPEGTSKVGGVFTQLNVPIAQQWLLELGARYDYFETEAKNLGEDRNDDAMSYSAAISWQTSQWLQLTLRYDEAFRAPSSEELYSVGTHFCMGPGFCNTFLPSPDLSAEEAANTEFIVNMNFAHLLGNDTLTIESSVFQNKIDNFIEQIVDDPNFSSFPPSAGNTYWVNVDKAEITGFEVAANYQIDSLKASISYGQSRGEDTSNNDDLTGIPADTWVFDGSYGFLQEQLHAGFRVSWADDQNDTDYAANINGTTYDSYTVTDLYAEWQPTRQSLEGLKVNLTVNNVSDESYRVAWEELDQAGRAVILSASYKF